MPVSLGIALGMITYSIPGSHDDRHYSGRHLLLGLAKMALCERVIFFQFNICLLLWQSSITSWTRYGRAIKEIVILYGGSAVGECMIVFSLSDWRPISYCCGSGVCRPRLRLCRRARGVSGLKNYVIIFFYILSQAQWPQMRSTCKISSP